MNDFEETLNRIDKFCSENSLKYVIIGGAAVIYYGYFRTTHDIDLTVISNLEDINNIHNKIKSKYNILVRDSLEFFSKNFVLPCRDKVTNLRIDFSAGLTEFDKEVIKRRIRKPFGKSEVFFCSLEDLIIYKLFAARPQDLVDAQTLLEKNKDSIDKDYLIKTCEKFVELDREDIKKNLLKFITL